VENSRKLLFSLFYDKNKSKIVIFCIVYMIKKSNGDLYGLLIIDVQISLIILISSRETFYSGSFEVLRWLKNVSGYKKYFFFLKISVEFNWGYWCWLFQAPHLDFYIQVKLGFNAFLARDLLILFLPFFFFSLVFFYLF
jgi:hypothetical protein